MVIDDRDDVLKKVAFLYFVLSIIYVILQAILEIFVNKDLGKLFIQVAIFIFIIILLEPYLKAFRDSSDKSELKLVKEQNSKRRQLFIRLGGEFDTDLFIYEIVGDQNDGVSDLADLKMFKAKVIEKVGPKMITILLEKQLK